MVLPAYAGMIPNDAADYARPFRAPRVCGDDPFEDGAGGDPVGCSPRMRG